MTITLDLSPEAGAYFQENAAREERAAEAMAQTLLAQAIQPGMDVYDDYDAAKARLEAR